MTLVMNWGSFLPSMAATNALYDGKSQPLLYNTSTHNHFEESPTMKALRMNTSESAISYRFLSLDGAENSDLDLASCLMMNEPMVSFGFTTGNDYKSASNSNNMRKPIYLDFSQFVYGPDDAEEEPALYVDIEFDEESPGVQNNDIGQILNINSLVGSVQPDNLTLSFFDFPHALQNLALVESGPSQLEQQKGNDQFREFLSLYLSVVSTIGGVIGYVAAMADMPDVVDAAANLGFIVGVGNTVLEIRSSLEDPRNSRLGYFARLLWKIWSMIRGSKNATEDE
ncbi:uncharacterized protein Triagg1_621 [Trichoderma aggressivum f. europaeum]|uniref:Uncharacterized protein n=1 Tax=Trichoderma aggressivum f. europaeum TaxID=173218 RepID=A0AAE1MAB2_9HYPO|nr:hypothetical protein Triagg1_621 [Trichoderma aggressivum f. europaeum]